MNRILLHPEANDDPRVLRWITGQSLPPEHTRTALAHLVRDGVLDGIDISAGQVRTRLAPGRDWQSDGAVVRSALFAALTGAESTQPSGDECAQPSGDESRPAVDLQRGIADLLERGASAVAASHGGNIRLLDVTDGVVTIEMAGACVGCSAAGRTLEKLISETVRARYPEVRAVRAVHPTPRARAARLLPALSRRRGRPA